MVTCFWGLTQSSFSHSGASAPLCVPLSVYKYIHMDCGMGQLKVSADKFSLG